MCVRLRVELQYTGSPSLLKCQQHWMLNQSQLLSHKWWRSNRTNLPLMPLFISSVHHCLKGTGTLLCTQSVLFSRQVCVCGLTHITQTCSCGEISRLAGIQSPRCVHLKWGMKRVKNENAEKFQSQNVTITPWHRRRVEVRVHCREK